MSLICIYNPLIEDNDNVPFWESHVDNVFQMIAISLYMRSTYLDFGNLSLLMMRDCYFSLPSCRVLHQYLPFLGEADQVSSEMNACNFWNMKLILIVYIMINSTWYMYNLKQDNLQYMLAILYSTMQIKSGGGLTKVDSCSSCLIQIRYI